jgi:hypothetical protein
MIRTNVWQLDLKMDIFIVVYLINLYIIRQMIHHFKIM